MSGNQKTDDVSATGKKSFSKMSGSEKLKHVCKVMVFLITFGFAFPNVFSD